MKLFLKILSVFTTLMLSSAVYGQSEKECEVMIDSAIQKMFRKEHTKSLEMLIRVKSVAEQKKWDKQNFRATNNIGLNYYLMTDFGEALKYYLEAYDIAANMPDKKHVMTVVNNIAILYFQEKDNKKAYEYFLKAYQTAKENNRNDKAGAYAVNLGLVLNKLNKTNEAYKYIQEAEVLTKDDPKVHVMNKMALAENLYLKKKYKESEDIINHLIPQLQSPEENENLIFILLIKAQINEKKGDLTEARSLALQARKLSPNINNREEVYNYLSKINAETKNYDESLKYKDSVIIANDSISKVNNSALFNNGKIKFEMQNYQFELKESQQRLKEERKIFYIIIASAIIIILLVLLFLYNNSIKYRQQKKITQLEFEKKQSDNLILTQQLKEQETLSLLEKERLRNEIEQQNRQLTSQALTISSRNEVVEEIIEAIVNQPEISNNSKLVNSIKDLKIQLKSNNQWDSFFKHFEGVNQNFITILKERHPDLSSSEIRFICYVYMNLSHKEIASILNISPESCRKRKERISKKLNLPDKINLYDYISAI
ncbi:hypothetical protein [Epilithonimonas sp.]|uniref:tetratricopeptide repeat protein n=1 Tax=Epilithonimonas sp. TaxID=2894511 RepID=UPI0035B39DC5